MSHQHLIKNISQQSYTIWDNFLPTDTSLALLKHAKYLHENQTFKAAKIGHAMTSQENQQIRKDEIFWLENEPSEEPLSIYLQAIKSMASALNEAFYLGLFDVETHFAHYAPGCFYKKHVDQFQTKNTRKISFVYYLNQTWDDSFGGQLALYDRQDQPLATILPTFNRLVCFESDLPHEVLVTHRPRWSLTGWLRTRD